MRIFSRLAAAAVALAPLDKRIRIYTEPEKGSYRDPKLDALI